VEKATVLDERAIARDMSPDVAWPTIIFSFVLPAVHLTLVWLGLTGVFSIWALMPVLGFTAYMHYTIVHEAIHRNMVRRDRRFDPVNTTLGWIGSIAIGTTWPLLHRTHLAHHAHTNTQKDADYFLKGSYPRLLAIWVVSIVANLIPVPWVKWSFDKLGFDSGYLNTRELMTEREWQLHLIAHTGLCAFVWGMIAIGYGPQVIALFVLPAAIGRLLLGTFQQWLPHAPFTESSRYRQARISKVPGGPLLYMGHDVHLVHHLWPSVPFYNYARFFRAIEPILREKDVRIEGLVPQVPRPPSDSGGQPAAL
jgi:beta-carotene hydroxylase